MPAKKYNDDIINEAAILRETGMSVDAIAKRLGMSRGSVSWHCLRLGADSPNTVTNVSDPKGPMVVARGDHYVKRFTATEDRALIDMDIAGWRVCDMARALDRKPNSIRGRLMTLARREARAEQRECMA
ncbi:MAG: hypothetical protein KJ731_21160 [Alphaproteobacteria bacterium]|uniref:Putative DNA binding, helix-turn-helix domain containing protein n=1 Tax=viral metagenome TaxID=1070528 RepID=A0A6M3JL78_9ZZZZ|nr:hypothetical protein [Alphaproteobacteria bacterium]MBU1280295.1 hypothetical protein [Alphaproteobacteria bacterium]MBU1830960.1 hypothetical protein [Alphaproteobacteria bacterium]MBU2079993.1 hypothetical protein [Alphaproteobacteria bacterium]MBU2244184.1 hypothetical protein [Alphaproteobacteria bacterium]